MATRGGKESMIPEWQSTNHLLKRGVLQTHGYHGDEVMKNHVAKVQNILHVSMKIGGGKSRRASRFFLQFLKKKYIYIEHNSKNIKRQEKQTLPAV